jgi:predicted  nucleic acid-binding Zn-ribbon protein
MKKLIFKEVSILSKVEKAGRTETFDPTTNLLTGENDVGKSTLIKCLYHTLGADVTGLQNTHWKNARPIYCLRFALDEIEYTILRDERYFGVFDKAKKLIGRFTGITGDRGIARFLNPLLDFRIELERADDGKLGLAGPAFYFLPFYVDQDEGWTRSWASFGGLQQFSSYRKNMLEYHLGVRPQSYYDAKKQFVELAEEKTKLATDRVTLASVRESYQKRKATRQLDIDPAIFRKEVEELVDLYNKVYARQQQVMQELKEVRNDRHGLENEILVLQRAIRELDADYALAEDPDTPDPVGCPTCGTEIANSIVERFGILDDIDYCYSLIDQRKKKLVDVVEQEKAVDGKYREVTAELAPTEDLLKRKREKVTFAEFVAAEGMKEIVSSMSEDINGIAMREEDLRKSLDQLDDDLKVDSKQKKEINEYYQARMKEYLASLSVNVLSAGDYKTFDKQIRTNALGSDLPRSLLAQYFAFLQTMAKFNSSIACPLVLDSPLQQEQDKDNIGAIFRFIFSRVLPGQQLILGTLSLDNVPDGIIPANAKRIHLTDELHLLQKTQYADIMDRIGKMHEQTLAAE